MRSIIFKPINNPYDVHGLSYEPNLLSSLRIGRALDAPAARISADSVDFGRLVYKIGMQTRTLTITNPTSSTVELTDFTLDGTAYKQANDCGTLAPGAHCALTLSFDSQTMGYTADVLRYREHHDDGSAKSQSIPITSDVYDIVVNLTRQPRGKRSMRLAAKPTR